MTLTIGWSAVQAISAFIGALASVLGFFVWLNKLFVDNAIRRATNGHFADIEKRLTTLETEMVGVPCRVSARACGQGD